MRQKVIDSHPSGIDNRFLNQFDEFKRFTEKSVQSATENEHPTEPPFANQTQTPDEIMRVAHKQIETSLAQDLLDRTAPHHPRFF